MSGPAVLTADGILVGQGGGFTGVYYVFLLPASADVVQFKSGVSAHALPPYPLPWISATQVLAWGAALDAEGFFTVADPPFSPSIYYSLTLKLPRRPART